MEIQKHVHCLKSKVTDYGYPEFSQDMIRAISLRLATTEWGEGLTKTKNPAMQRL